MPAHAQVKPRTIGLSSGGAQKSKAAEAAQPRRNARGRQGDLELLDWLVAKAAGANSVCTVTDQIARGLDVAGETVRQRLLRLTFDGMVAIENCQCKAMPYSHRKFTLVRNAPQPAPVAVVAAPPAKASKGGVQAAGDARAESDAANNGDAILLDHLRKQLAGRDHFCATTDMIAKGLDVAGRTVFRRLDRLKATGAVKVAACTCAELPTAHRRFQLGTSAAVAAPTPAPAPIATKAAAATVMAAPLPAGVDLRQLVAAQPDTWALFRDGRVLWREPVVAWGLWHDGAKGTGTGGPLIYVAGRLDAAASVPGFAGVRIGAYRCLGDDRTFDDALLAQELE